MKARIGLAKICVLGAVLSSAAWASTGALAQAGGSATGANAFDDGLPTSAVWPANTPPAGAAPIVGKAAPAPAPSWWTHGVIEAGGRDYLNDPQNGGQKLLGGQSLSSYYEYSDERPGPFGNFDIAFGTSDGVYQVEIGGVNVGYRDQTYFLDYSKAGEQYFSFIWDQTPHLYSSNALSPYWLIGNIENLQGPTLSTVLPWTIGIDRDTAAASYRWTPGSDWDFNLDYSRMTRTGTQPTQVGEGATTTIATPTQVMKPVDDTTQNYGSKGEYVGSSPWGGRYVLSVGYDGSQYQDRWSNFVVQGNLPSAAAKYAYVSTWPSNQANAFSSTLTADLPWQSRYAGTLSYTMMTQNAAFPQMSPVANPYVLAAPNLDGDINTLLSNNVVTTKIASDLTAKTSFRYYDFKNNTPTLGADATESGTGSIDKNAASAAVTVNSLSMAYIKTNIGEALNWRPSKEWNLGAAYGFERYDWTRADADVTNENSGKVFADWKPWTWLTSRASTEFSVRRYENYDYYNYVGNFQWSLFSPYVGDYANSERQFYLDNRQLWKANYSLDVVVLPNVTITPWTKYQDANYGVDPLNQQGLQDQKSWDFGVDGVYVVSPDLSFMASYSRMSMAEVEYGSTQVNGSLAGPYYYNPGNQTITNESNVVNTFVTAVKYTPIPGKLDTELRYTAAHGVDDLYLLATTAATAVPSTGGQFPENKTWFQRLDATATYKFDPQQVAALGWKGDIKAKLHYTWESNSESNWANDPLAFNNYTAPAGLWLGWYNPNYNVQMLSASLIASW